MNEEPKFLGRQEEGKAVTLDWVEVVHRVGICRAWRVPSREDWKSAAVSNDVALEER